METETRQFATRSKRDAESLTRLLKDTAADHPVLGRRKVEVARDCRASRWAVQHNLPKWVIELATRQAYRRGAMVQVAYLEEHLRDSYPEV